MKALLQSMILKPFGSNGKAIRSSSVPGLLMTFTIVLMIFLCIVRRAFRKRFEKRFDLKSDDRVEVYLGNRIQHDRIKGTVTVDQEHYVLACLKKFGLARCNGVDKPINSRLTIRESGPA